MISMK